MKESDIQKVAVSVIIPIYKVEKYIEKCVRSLFDQTLYSIEYIFIDDCSPDDSLQILYNVIQEYPERESYVKIIKHMQNLGVGKSRQDGINAATGKYIIHCDPDDWIDPDMYESLYKKATEDNSDIVLCDYMTHNGQYSTYCSQYVPEITSDLLLAMLCGVKSQTANGLWSLWNKLIKAECYVGCNFREDSFMWEDVLILMSILKKRYKVTHVAKAYYHYRINDPHSLTHRSIDAEVLQHDSQLLHILYKLLYTPTDIRLQQCYHAAVTLIVLRTFNTSRSLFSDAEWKNRYGEYTSFAKACDIRTFHKLLIYLSCKGLYKCCWYSFSLLKHIRNLLFHRRSSKIGYL